MKSLTFWIAGTLIVAAAAVSAGCGAKQAPEKPAAKVAEEHGEHGATSAPVTPASTGTGIWGQIEDERQELVSVIESARLSEVHHLAFAIRDLANTLAEQTSGLSPSDAESLKTVLAAIAEGASKLDEYGDSGNLGATKEEFARFEASLERLKALTVH